MFSVTWVGPNGARKVKNYRYIDGFLGHIDDAKSKRWRPLSWCWNNRFEENLNFWVQHRKVYNWQTLTKKLGWVKKVGVDSYFQRLIDSKKDWELNREGSGEFQVLFESRSDFSEFVRCYQSLEQLRRHVTYAWEDGYIPVTVSYRGKVAALKTAEHISPGPIFRHIQYLIDSKFCG